MSMIKIVTPESLETDQPTIQLVKMASAGLTGYDLRTFRKRGAAEDLLKQAAALRDKVASDETLIHLIAMGSTSSTGPNRNGDGFRSEVLRQYHPTFVKHAHFYRDHKNTDPLKSYGRVVTSAYNEPMQRIELLVALSNNKEAAARNRGLIADKELTKLASGLPLPVSMACITDPTALICTSNGYKQIRDIVVGDLVPTHRGRWRKVTELRRRKYTGEVVTVEVIGLPAPLKLTADHPMYGKILHTYAANNSRGQRPPAQWSQEVADGVEPFSWLAIGDMAKGDKLDCHALGPIPGVAGITDTKLAALLGTYISEGNIRFCNDTPNTVQFTIHADDWAVRGIPAIMHELWPDVSVELTPRKNSTVAMNLSIYSTELAKWCFKLHGQGAAVKTIPAELLNGSREAKLEFMGRWLDGDGWCDMKGAHWSSCNMPLILQGRDMLLSLGIAASIYKIDHSKCATSGYENSGMEYTLNVSNMDQAELSRHSMKVGYSPYRQDGVPRKNPGCLRPVGDSYAYGIRAIHREQVVDAETWNFEVDEDHSYSLFGTSSHNCSVNHDLCSYCGNKAPTVASYCSGTYEGGHCKAGGLRHNIGSLIEIDNGIHHLHADNPHPNFFDISHVTRPADRIAYVTGRLKTASASTVIKSAELAAAMCLQVPLDLRLATTTSKIASDQLRHLYMLAEQERMAADGAYAISPSHALAFTKVAQQEDTPLPPLKDFQYKVASVMRALADDRNLLPISRFIELFTATPIEKTAELATLTQLAVPGAYNRLVQSDNCEQQLHNNPYLPAKTASASDREWSHQLVPQFSVKESVLRSRVQRSALHGCLDPEFITEAAGNVKLAAVAGTDAIHSLAEQYCLYKLAFLQAVPETELPLTVALTIMQNYSA